LNGDLSLSELADRYREDLEFNDMIAILTKLNDEGILEDASHASSLLSKDCLARYRSQMMFFSHFDQNQFASQEKLAGATVGVAGFGSTHSAVCASLARMGVGALVKIEIEPPERHAQEAAPSEDRAAVSKSPRDTSLELINPGVKISSASLDDGGGLVEMAKGCNVIVSASDSIAFSMQDVMHRLSLRLNVPWITCGPLNSIEGLVGPFFVPRETCCYYCYQTRLKSNLTRYDEQIAFEDYVKKNEGRTAEFGFLHPFPMIL
jgi:molybdopterin/thiamine biosynthesis adenylyltransferase